METPWTPPSLVGGLAAVAAVLLTLYGAALHDQLSLEEGHEVVTHLLAPAASVSRGFGLAGLVDRWGQARDAWYEGGAAWGAVADPQGRPAPRPVPAELAAATDDGSGGEVDTGAEAAPADDEVAPATLPSRILIIGASSVQFDLGRALETQLERRPGLTVERWGRHSTGLSRADYFDWLAKAVELADGFGPDLVIAQMGGNDCQVITNVDGSEVARFPTDAWEPAYAERVTSLIDLMRQRGARVVFLGMPIMRSPSFRTKVERLNRVTRAAVEATGERYISTWELSADANGAYRGTAVVDGREVVFRASDGIHMSADGAEYVAAHVIAEIEATLGLPPLGEPDEHGDDH
ncbi:MAG: DUF459 domain-containing protein [Myxococcales bacterium]|nr:DUF459 domain-containing protein [Myxococcales bacterium]MCB9533975.1 DUF459 domain-containing protein [Myxococcales bacterium]